MIDFKSFGWGATFHSNANGSTTTIVWPEDIAVAGPHRPGCGPGGDMVPPTDRSQAWYYQHPGPYVNASDALSNSLRRVAEQWEAYGLTARQGEFLRDSCGPDPWKEAIARGFCPAREVYCPPDYVGSMPYWEAILPRLNVGWQPLVPFIGARGDQLVHY